MDPDDLLDGLTPAQRQAVRTDGAPLCILAGPGSGKTRVLTRRIARRVATGTADAGHVLAITFTRQAAAELTRRLNRLGMRESVAAGTFHAVAYAQLRRRWADRGERPATLLEHKLGLLGDLVERGAQEKAGPLEVAGEIEWAKARMVAPVDYEAAATAAGRRPALPAAVIASLYGRYEDEKRRRGLIDFDDLLLLCARAVETDADFAAVQRWRFRHLFVDEFQDVNPLQFRLLEAWRAGRDDLCVVGDPHQSIYAWNGADPSLLGDFTVRFPAATVVALPDSFRSTPEIVSAATRVLATGGDATPLQVHRGSGPSPVVREFASDIDEARGVARGVRDRRRPGSAWSGTAVLARTRAQLDLLADALRAAGIPVRLRGRAPLLSRPDVRSAIADLRRLPAATPLAAAVADVEAHVLVELAGEHRAIDDAATVESFIAWVAATGGDDPGHGGDAVTLATFHAAKGLEWPIVFIAGLEQGLVPIWHAGGESLEEERRLLYVAVTRARDELHCSWARRRTFRDRTVDREPSPWLAALAPAAVGPDPSPPRRSRPVAAERRRLAETARPYRRRSTLVDALRSWRVAIARASGVAPPVVMPDRTIEALARARPRSATELLDVPGIGPVKAERYGPQLLSLLAEADR